MARMLRSFPLLLLALMLLIGLGLEAVYYDGPQWLVKLPVLALLGAYIWRTRVREAR